LKAVVFLPEAREEMLEAATYYDTRSPGLGMAFLSEMERAESSIKASPTAWPIIEGKFRRRLLRRFPFSIIYIIEPKEIIFVAIAHLRRNPQYWKARI
jgi:toxin ParE1/3/4